MARFWILLHTSIWVWIWAICSICKQILYTTSLIHNKLNSVRLTRWSRNFSIKLGKPFTKFVVIGSLQWRLCTFWLEELGRFESQCKVRIYSSSSRVFIKLVAFMQIYPTSTEKSDSRLVVVENCPTLILLLIANAFSLPTRQSA